MIRVLFFVVLVMALVALRNHLRVRRTYAHIGVAVPKHVTVSLLGTGALALLALASLLGLATRLGTTGVIVCGAVAYVALLRAATDPVPTLTEGQSGPRRFLVPGLVWAALAIWVVALFPSLTSFATSADRTLYFKLPIEGARFHWVFLDPEAFLSGELTLRILNKDRDQTLVVFRDGKIHDSWEMIGDARPDGGFYFGFSTTDRVRTKADDSLIVTLKATKNLLGRGPFSEGVLSAGVWEMSGTYSSIYGGRWNPLDFAVRHGDPPIAFMQCWTGVWPITITKREGWMGTPARDEISVDRKLNRSRGTNGRLCASHM